MRELRDYSRFRNVDELPEEEALKAWPRKDRVHRTTRRLPLGCQVMSISETSHNWSKGHANDFREATTLLPQDVPTSYDLLTNRKENAYRTDSEIKLGMSIIRLRPE